MSKYVNRFFELGEQSCFIFGPRETGKSTFLKHQTDESLFIDLRISDTFRRINARPDLLTEMIKERPSIKKIIIDEIQRIPDLLPVIHKMIEVIKICNSSWPDQVQGN
ncbi:MAG: AAA family ATPase [Saprospiraceae bacterium]